MRWDTGITPKHIIRLFQQIKELKEKGYQLKAIKTALDKIMEDGKDPVIPDELLEESVTRP